MPNEREYGNIREREKLEIFVTDTIRATLAELYPGLADSSEFTDERIRNMNLPRISHYNKMRREECSLPRCEERRKRIINDCVSAVEAGLERIYDRKVELLEPEEHEIDLTGQVNNFRELVDYLEGEIYEAAERVGSVT